MTVLFILFISLSACYGAFLDPDGPSGPPGTESGYDADSGLDSATPEPVVGAAPLRINEFLADNERGATDGVGDRDDWIELYNPGDEPVSLAGWAMSDDLSDRSPWELDASLAIDAGGFLLLWADDQPEEGPDHLNFSLSAGGEAIALYAPDGQAIDAVAFGAQVVDVSAALVDDGGDEWVLCADPTPGVSNAEAR